MNSLIVCFLLAVVLQTVTPKDAPGIAFVSPKQVKSIGGTVDLKCSTKNAKNFPILWVKVEGQNGIYISSGTSLLVPDSRYSVTYDHSSSSLTLTIRDLQTTDAGLYQCRLNISPGNARFASDVELELQSP